jgi:hypothetical protein
MLSDAVIIGLWPKAETEVLKRVTVAGHNCWLGEDMETPRVACQRMVAYSRA